MTKSGTSCADGTKPPAAGRLVELGWLGTSFALPSVAASCRLLRQRVLTGRPRSLAIVERRHERSTVCRYGVRLYLLVTSTTSRTWRLVNLLAFRLEY